MGKPQEPLKIRTMTARDLKWVLSLGHHGALAGWSEPSFLEAIENREGINFIAESGSKPVAYLTAFTLLDEAQITNLLVVPRCRRRGVATSLLEELIVSVGKRGVCRLILEVRRNNEDALRFYTGLGFQLVGLRKNYYKDPLEDALVMAYPISEKWVAS